MKKKKKVGRPPNIERYKHIIALRKSREKRESITRGQYGSYRDIQKILRVSPNTIKKAYDWEKKQKQKRKKS